MWNLSWRLVNAFLISFFLSNSHIPVPRIFMHKLVPGITFKKRVKNTKVFITSVWKQDEKVSSRNDCFIFKECYVRPSFFSLKIKTWMASKIKWVGYVEINLVRLGAYPYTQLYIHSDRQTDLWHQYWHRYHHFYRDCCDRNLMDQWFHTVTPWTLKQSMEV